MSTVLEQPKPHIFEAVNYFDKRVVGSNVKRWVWFPGDLIVPERKAEIDWLQVGGEETTSPCLQRYGRGFVPRGLSALLELGGEPIPMRHLGDLQSVAWQGIPLNENAVKNNLGFVPVYPGDGLRILLRYARNDGGIRKGLDEDTALLSKDWEEAHNGFGFCLNGHHQTSIGSVTLDRLTTDDKCPECKSVLSVNGGDGILDVIERAMFTDGMEKTLSGLEDQIRHVQVSDSRVDIGKMKADRLRMCDEFRNWATRKVNYEHGLLKSGTVAIANDAVGSIGGWSYSYSPVVDMLLQQLGIPRQDQPLQEMARMIGSLPQPVAPPGLSAADMELIQARMADQFNSQIETRLAAAREVDQRRIAELEAQLRGESDTSKTYTCEHCNEEVKLTGKGLHIGRHCKVLNPKGEPKSE